MQLADSIPKVLSAVPAAESESQPLPSTTYSKAPPSPLPGLVDSSAVDLQPEIEPTDRVWTSVDLALTVNAVRVHLYDGAATLESDLKNRGVACLALTNSNLRYKTLSNGAAEAELVIKSFTMSNTRAGPTKFREIIPAAQHHRNQFMVLYTTSGGINPASLAIVTVDSPKVIFSVDPVFALLDFFRKAPEPECGEDSNTNPVRAVAQTNTQDSTHQPIGIDFRIDLHDVTISVLEGDAIAETQAIQLSVKQILVSHQVGWLCSYY